MKRRRRIAGLALLPLLVALATCSRPPSGPPANVLLIVVDTLRADHLGSYGYGRPTSPHLDEFAQRGARFASARAASSWTLPSVASMMTGLYPAVHGAENSEAVLSDRIPTMAEAFRAAGYDTVAFSANPAFVTPLQGLDRGFDRFTVLHGPQADKKTLGATPADPAMRSWVLDAKAPDVTSAALAWLQARESKRPFFLYLHYFDPHGAYDPPVEFAGKFGVASDDPLRGEAQLPVLLAPEPPDAVTLATLVSLYDGEIASVDDGIGRLLAGLPPAVTASTVMLVTADHGEEFGDHGGMQHGRTLFDELLHVPLIVAGPNVPAGVVVRSPVSLVGLWATLSALSGGAAAPPPNAGASFAPLLVNEDPRGQPLYADLDSRFPNDRQQHRRAMIDGNWKLILDTKRADLLFDVDADKSERNNRSDAERPRVGTMRSRILDRDATAWASRTEAPPGQVVLDPIRRSQLESLGYLH